MKKLIILLMGFCLAQGPVAYGMNKDKHVPTIEDEDGNFVPLIEDGDSDEETNFQDARDNSASLVTTGAGKPTSVTQLQPNSPSNLTHVASVANGQGQVRHIGINTGAISGAINNLSTNVANSLSAATPKVTAAMAQLADQANQTGEIVSASIDLTGQHAAKAVSSVGNALSGAAGKTMTAATSAVATQVGRAAHAVSHAVTKTLNGIDDEGRATLSEMATVYQNVANTSAASAQKTIQAAGTQARTVVNATGGQIRGTVNAIGGQVNQAITSVTSVANPENITAALNSAPVQSVAGKTNLLLDQGTKLIAEAQPVIQNVANFTGSVAQQTPAILQNVNTLLYSMARNMNPQLGNYDGSQQQLPPTGQQGPIIEDADDELPALPTAQEFAQLPQAQKIRAQRQLLGSVNETVQQSTTAVSKEFVTQAKKAIGKTRSGTALTGQEYTTLLQATQGTKDTNGPLLLEWRTQDNNNPAAVNPGNNQNNQPPQPAASATELGTLRHELNTETRRENTGHQTPPAPHRFRIHLPKPVLVISACMCVTGLIIVTKKLYTKWKKNKEKREQREQQKQQAAAQKEHNLAATVAAK